MTLLLLAACADPAATVTMTAAVWNAPYGEGEVVPGATVIVTDEARTVWDEVRAGDDGAFTAEVPAGVPFFVETRADGHVPTAFSGTAGLSDFTAPSGYPWVAPTGWVDALRAEFAACPAAAESGAIVAGEIVADAAQYPVLPTGSARVLAPDDVEYAACYLDDEGAPLADGTEVGATGRFAIFGVPEGEILVDVRYDTGTDEDPVQLFRFFAPAEGLVPVYPAILPVL
jgi:hypothetical protein